MPNNHWFGPDQDIPFYFVDIHINVEELKTLRVYTDLILKAYLSFEQGEYQDVYRSARVAMENIQLILRTIEPSGQQDDVFLDLHIYEVGYLYLGLKVVLALQGVAIIDSVNEQINSFCGYLLPHYQRHIDKFTNFRAMPLNYKMTILQRIRTYHEVTREFLNEKGKRLSALFPEWRIIQAGSNSCFAVKDFILTDGSIRCVGVSDDSICVYQKPYTSTWDFLDEPLTYIQTGNKASLNQELSRYIRVGDLNTILTLNKTIKMQNLLKGDGEDRISNIALR